MSDVVERARAVLKHPDTRIGHALVADLVAEVERLQAAGKTLGKIIDDSLRDVLKATDSYDLVDENLDGDWMLIFERLAALRPARDAALAELEELRQGGPWVEHVERQRAMKRERDGECICNTGPDTGGPEEDCPWHGREYRYWVDGVAAKAAEIERLQAQLLLPHLYPCVCTRNMQTGEVLDYDCGRQIGGAS